MWKSSSFRSIALLILGLSLAGINYAWHQYSGWRLPPDQYQRSLVITGNIASLPQPTAMGSSFLVDLNTIEDQSVNAQIRLVSYEHLPLEAGDCWQFTVRLKPLHSLHNFGVPDRTRYLWLQGLRASGYVVQKTESVRCAANSSAYPLLRFRQNIQERIEKLLIKFPEEAAIISALTVGSTTHLSPQQWKVFQRTGTSHLVAISGLHIGLMAAVGFSIFKFLSKFAPAAWFLRFPKPYWGGVGSLIFAVVYSAMAGFAWPTQRSLIMILCLNLTQFWNRGMPLWRRLSIAGIVIVILQPWAIFSASFCLSFCAVLCLCYVLDGRWKKGSNVQQWWAMQWGIFIGLLPISLYYFKQFSWMMWIANFIAIPWVAWVIVPLSLLACFSLSISETVAYGILWLTAKLLMALWFILEYLANYSFAIWHEVLKAPWALLVAIAGAALLLLPKGFPGRCLGCLWFVTMILYRPSPPTAPGFYLTLLDVGQGLSLVIRTAHHVMVYDTGPSFQGIVDSGRDVVVPYLESQGISTIDVMMISHGDNDHSGGAAAIAGALEVKAVFTSIPEKFINLGARACAEGQHWKWDGVNFEILSPPPGMSYEGNNSSCVLRISQGHNSVLLPGDIEKQREHSLVKRWGSGLGSTLIVAPHHGSISSSSESFLKEIKPHYVLFSVGYLNRYHFPNPKVVSRYEEYHAKMLRSSEVGAMEFRFQPDGLIRIKTATSID